MRVRHLPTLLLLGAAAVAAGQNLAPAEAPAGVTVLKYRWRNATRPAALDHPTTSAAEHSLENTLPGGLPPGDRGPGPAHPLGVTPARQSAEASRVQRNRRTDTPNPIEGDTQSDAWRRVGAYAYEVRITNEAAQTIEAVEWDYVFVEPGAGRELARHRFRNFNRAKPGKSLTLTGNSAAPPTRVISAAGREVGDGKQKLFDERVVIRCVLYADGTARWRDAGGERDCEGIRARAQAKKSR